MHRILVIGAVNSTKTTLQELIKHRFDVVGVLGHEPNNKDSVSGWVNLEEIAKNKQIAYKGFSKINDSENIIWAKEKNPDIIFAVGFSQLLSEEWLQMPTLGCIGFHPTKLPQGRGRAPLAWLVLEEKEGAASFFLMGKGADDGPIFVQKPFVVESQDDAESVRNKIEQAISTALDKWLPDLKNGLWEPIPQNEYEASWYGKRSPEDGLINWEASNFTIDRLIKASSSPHPGAYTYFKQKKLIIWSSEREESIPIKGVTGRVLLQNEDKGYLVQCGTGLIWIKDIEGETKDQIQVGSSLRYYIDDEITQIWEEIKNIKKKLDE